MRIRVCVGRWMLVAAAALGLGCQGERSADPPVHLNPNMDFQSKFITQTQNAFFADQRAMRPPVPGTIARGELEDDDHFFRGKSGATYATTLPAQVGTDLTKILRRGQERYNIYCRPCHGGLGDGKGLVAARNMAVPPTSYFDKRVLGFTLGEFFEVISDGRRNMPPFRYQIPPADRWAIAAYVRTLQRSVSGSF